MTVPATTQPANHVAEDDDVCSWLPTERRLQLCANIIATTAHYLTSLPDADQSRTIQALLHELQLLQSEELTHIVSTIETGLMVVGSAGQSPHGWLGRLKPYGFTLTLHNRFELPVTVEGLRDSAKSFLKRSKILRALKMNVLSLIAADQPGHPQDCQAVRLYYRSFRYLGDIGIQTKRWFRYLAAQHQALTPELHNDMCTGCLEGQHPPLHLIRRSFRLNPRPLWGTTPKVYPFG